MSDIFLHRYNTTDSINVYNAPHKFRFALKKGLETSEILKLWNTKKEKVLGKLTDAIKEKFNTEFKFAIALAPSNTTYFINDIRNHLRNVLINSVDISDCFTKSTGFEAGIIDHALTDEELRNGILLNNECFKRIVVPEIREILLVDDVFSSGNTFNAMKLAISDIDPTLDIVTAVILTTQQVQQ